MLPPAILETHAEGLPCRRGKVRDVYDLGDRVALVATDRLSAFDWVLPNGVPDKGKALTALSMFWFAKLGVPHHAVSMDLDDFPSAFAAQPEVFAGRSMLCLKTQVVPFECVARGYLAGSGWAEYQRRGTVCGVELPPGLQQADRLPEPIFTPATKAETGHDENIDFAALSNGAGAELAAQLRDRTLGLYRRAAAHALDCGIILADTKFEFGRRPNGELLLIDEALTPDSSRYWPADQWRPGRSPPSFDKQFVRDWLESIGFDKQSPPPPMPPAVVEKTRTKYLEACRRLAGIAL